MTKDFSKELLLILKHEEYPHWEYWYANDDPNVISVIFDTPFNSPPRGEHDLSVVEALRQYALMTSTEGWEVYEDWGFHDFIDLFDIDR